MSELRDLWKEHCVEPFPPTAYDCEVDIVSIDSSASGVISSYLEGSSSLDPDSVLVLERCAEQIYSELDVIDPPQRDYFTRLLQMIRMVHAALSHQCPCTNQQNKPAMDKPDLAAS